MPAYKREDFASGQEVRWCPGCGDYAVLAAVQKAMPEICSELGLTKERVVFISGIGCSSRFPYYMSCYGFHTVHGRAPAIATGIKVANPDLLVWVVTGDGDSLSIGGNHTLHCLRRNVGVKILMFNNNIYGLTKGQYSPTSPKGKVTKSSPLGSVDQPVNPVAFALGCGAGLVLRAVDRDMAHLVEMLKAAARHPGAVYVEILQNCVVYNDGAFRFVMDPAQKPVHALYLKPGGPMVFGPEGRFALVWKEGRLSKVEKASVPETSVVRHDPANRTQAFALSQLWHPECVPLGVFHRAETPVYESEVLRLESEASAKSPADLKALFRSGLSWRVQ
ncbi:MAG: 2-oxoacid:ferredoxin oxidoreductase subunit beta [Elusimicrobia bacterium]|nr:2-oxoacid:ferredoxin oxidoreductase subunit beta [Elusimicrobiota bacterium]